MKNKTVKTIVGGMFLMVPFLANAMMPHPENRQVKTVQFSSKPDSEAIPREAFVDLRERYDKLQKTLDALRKNLEEKWKPAEAQPLQVRDEKGTKQALLLDIDRLIALCQIQTELNKQRCLFEEYFVRKSLTFSQNFEKEKKRLYSESEKAKNNILDYMNNLQKISNEKMPNIKRCQVLANEIAKNQYAIENMLGILENKFIGTNSNDSKLKGNMKEFVALRKKEMELCLKKIGYELEIENIERKIKLCQPFLLQSSFDFEQSLQRQEEEDSLLREKEKLTVEYEQYLKEMESMSNLKKEMVVGILEKLTDKKQRLFKEVDNKITAYFDQIYDREKERKRLEFVMSVMDGGVRENSEFVGTLIKTMMELNSKLLALTKKPIIFSGKKTFMKFGNEVQKIEKQLAKFNIAPRKN